jgi:predicted PurR-regulated permease PerM
LKKNIQIFQDWFQKLTVMQKRYLAIACTVVFSALLTISVFMSLRVPVVEKIPGVPERITVFSPIPAQEIFFPDEPDYLPTVLFQREQRTGWTAEDAAEHWQDPLGFGEEQWRLRIEAAIDEFLEHVP